jgi:hypothetical protein
MDDILEQLHVDWMRINNVEIPIEVLSEIVFKRGLDNVRHTLRENELKKDVRQNFTAFKALSTKEKIAEIEKPQYGIPDLDFITPPDWYQTCVKMYYILRKSDIVSPDLETEKQLRFNEMFEEMFQMIEPTLLPF